MDEKLGLQTILIRPNEESDLVCPVQKTPFLNRSSFINLLNSQECASSNPLTGTLATDINFDYSWNKYRFFTIYRKSSFKLYKCGLCCICSW